MKMFIWKRINKVSDNWHPEGGLVIIAKDEEEARYLANTTIAVILEESEKVDFSCDIICEKQQIFTFPDAGCC